MPSVRMGGAVVVATAVALSSFVSSPSAASRHHEQVAYQPPVSGEVVDPFRAPAHPYGPGNRGLEYAVGEGSAVRAAAAGEVLYAGAVGSSLHVTVGHADGLRTSYSFLASVGVRRGQRVARGQPVGTALERVHFGVRDPDGTYLDPALLFNGESPDRVRLVPGRDEGRPPLSSELRLLRELVERRPDLHLASASRLVDRVRLLAHYSREVRLDVRAARLTAAAVDWHERSRHCTPVDAPIGPPGGRRLAVLVGGLGSRGSHGAIDDVDVDALGYEPADVVRFSYAGGRVPDGGGGAVLPRPPATPYGPDDTLQPLEASAQLLAHLLVDVSAASPGVPIDVIAHSQGGVVAAKALVDLAEGGLPAEVATLVTLGTPHGGADLATAAAAARLSPSVGLVVDAVSDLPSSRAVRDLAEISAVTASRPAQDIPSRVHVVSIGARGDLVVPVPRTRLPGHPWAVVPVTGTDAHSALPGSPAATREIALALGRRPPSCRSVGGALTDAAVGEAVSYAADLLGASLLAFAPP
jgi:hypothetical protein